MGNIVESTFVNAQVLIADVGLEGGTADLFCCTADVTIALEADRQNIVCDRRKPPVDVVTFNPSGTVTLREINFNTTVLQRAFLMSPSINTDGYRAMANGNDPNTTPSQDGDTDGPFSPSYTGNDAVITLNNALVIEDSIVAWTKGTTGIFSVVATFTANYANAATNLATGEIHITDTGTNTPLYFTYKYQPLSVGSTELKNPFNLQDNFVFIRILHEHTNGTDLYLFDFWKAKVQPTGTLVPQSSTGDVIVSVEMVYDLFGDTRNHPDAPLGIFTKDLIANTITPFFDCAGATFATPVAS